MYLHLDAASAQYANAPQQHVDKGPKFSFFKVPITNKYAFKSITILDAYNYIVGPMLRNRHRPFAPSPTRRRPRSTSSHTLLMPLFAANLTFAATKQ